MSGVSNSTYNIASGLLTGRIGKAVFRANVGSGGRAGSKAKDAYSWWLANNPLATHVGGAKSKGTHAYGPLPTGRYKLKLHESRMNWIRLIPDSSNQMFGRAGFAIHGRGQTGSHGCIVPTDFNVVLTLCRILKEREKASKKAPTLRVIAVGTDLDKKFWTA